MAAEYVAQRGNLDIVLCERGIRTFETATRNTLDISAVPVRHGAVAPAGDRRPVALRRPPRPGGAAVAGGDRGRRRRDHRRRAPAPGGRRCATARRRWSTATCARWRPPSASCRRCWAGGRLGRRGSADRRLSQAVDGRHRWSGSRPSAGVWLGMTLPRSPSRVGARRVRRVHLPRGHRGRGRCATRRPAPTRSRRSGDRTGAGTGCGSCHDELEDVLDRPARCERRATGAVASAPTGSTRVAGMQGDPRVIEFLNEQLTG